MVLDHQWSHKIAQAAFATLRRALVQDNEVVTSEASFGRVPPSLPRHLPAARH
jgi:hypothetical protein